MEKGNKKTYSMDIDESENSSNQATNQSQIHHNKKSVIDPKALEILKKNFEKKIPLKEFK